jgi:glycosyltransferase involved in cell wall biosynthesis
MNSKLLSTKIPTNTTDNLFWPWYGDKEKLPSAMLDGCPWPRISVVMPTFNHAKYLEAAICSVLYQEYPNLEFIIMDGGSTDGTIEIIRKYEKWISFWKSEPDKGQYYAIQNGFERSTGEILTWLNSSDLFLPWTFQTVVSVFTNIPAVRWLGSSVAALTDEDNLYNKFWNQSGINYRWFFEDCKLSQKGCIQQEGTFWTRTLWDEAGGKLDLSLPNAGDYELWARFWQYTDLATIATPLGIFRFHEDQKTSQMESYYREADEVLSRYRTFRRIPSRLLKLFIKIIPYPLTNKRWAYLRCSHPVYDIQNKKWILNRLYEI